MATDRHDEVDELIWEKSFSTWASTKHSEFTTSTESNKAFLGEGGHGR